MRRFVLIFALSLTCSLLAPVAAAQSTARPLPAFRLNAPISTVAASFSSGTAKAVTASSDTDSGLKPISATANDGPGTTEFSSLRLNAEARGNASFQDEAGGITTQRAGIDAILGRNFGGSRAVAVHIASESSFYKFDKSSTLVPGSATPFNDMFRTSAGIQIALEADQHFTWLAGVEATIAGEDLVGPSDSLVLGGLGGIRYRINDDVAFSFGLSGESRLSSDAWIVPFLGMDWDLTPDTRFSIQGSEVRFEHQLTETIELSCGARYDWRQYRLNGSGPVPDGVFRDEEIRISAGIDWNFSKDATLGLELGQVMWNEFTVLDSSGATVGQTEADPSSYIGFSLRFGM
jgi:hypothetical protein